MHLKPVFELPDFVSTLATEVVERNDSLMLSVLACPNTTCGVLAMPLSAFFVLYLCGIMVTNLKRKALTEQYIKQTFISVQNKSIEEGMLYMQKQEYNKKINM